MKAFKHKKYYFIFLFYFLIFGAAIAVLTSIINYNIRYVNIEDEIKKNAIKLAENRKRILSDYVKDAKNHLRSVAINPIMKEYLLQRTKNSNHSSKNNIYKEQVTNLFFSQMDSYEDMMKIRYIDEKGEEVIRLDRKKSQKESVIVKDLENKAERYYFIETSKLSEGNFLYSNLDLNVEHGKVEFPIIPTFRISTPLYVDKKFSGMVIISLKISNFFEIFQNSIEFNIYIVDGDGEFIIHPDPNKSWGRYLNKQYTLYNLYPSIAKSICTEKDFSFKLINSFDISSILNNKDNAKLIIEPNYDVITELKKNNIKNAIIIIITVIIISLPLAILIAYVPSKLQRRLQTAIDELNKKSTIIDKYVLHCFIDLDGKIMKASSAFQNLSEYTQDEILEKEIFFIDKSLYPKEFYEEVWSQIEKGNTWKGELTILTKSDTIIWIQSVITPEYNETGQSLGYTAISHNISDKKHIEKISVTDQLTKIYNRYKLDEMMEFELERSTRYGTPFSIILFDLDNFKSVNDTFGHLVGDTILIEISSLVKKNIRKTDILGRWGGEEFLILLTNTSLEGAVSIAENLRTIIENYPFPVVKKKTASFGVTTLSDGETADIITKRADDALYSAKKNGRNNVKSLPAR